MYEVRGHFSSCILLAKFTLLYELATTEYPQRADVSEVSMVSQDGNRNNCKHTEGYERKRVS